MNKRRTAKPTTAAAEAAEALAPTSGGAKSIEEKSAPEIKKRATPEKACDSALSTDSPEHATAKRSKVEVPTSTTADAVTTLSLGPTPPADPAPKPEKPAKPEKTRQCTKGHRFQWRKVGDVPVPDSKEFPPEVTHVNHCTSCKANRGACKLVDTGIDPCSVPREPIPLLEEALHGARLPTWAPRPLKAHLESRRQGQGSRRPYLTNSLRVSRFPDLPANTIVNCDVVVIQNGTLHCVRAVGTERSLQAPLQVQGSVPGTVVFHATLGPAEFRGLQPLPSDPKTERRRGIGWLSVLFHTQTPSKELKPLWLWDDIPVVSEKNRPAEPASTTPAVSSGLVQIALAALQEADKTAAKKPTEAEPKPNFSLSAASTMTPRSAAAVPDMTAQVK